MYGIEPRYNEPRYNEFFDITNIIRKPKRKIYLDITNYNVNTQQKINAEQINTLKVSFFCKQKLRVCSKLLLKATMLNELHLKTQHFWVTKIALNCVTEVTCVENKSLTMTSMKRHFVRFPQVRYIEVFDITNPRFNEQIWPVPCDFVKSRFHCIPVRIHPYFIRGM